MQAPNESFLVLWAKIEGDVVSGSRFHPLICHMIDVAAIADTLWHHVLSGAMKSGLAEGLQLSEADAGAWVPFIAALHDLGKASPAFQLHPSLGTELRQVLTDRLRSIGLDSRRARQPKRVGAMPASE